MKKYFQKLHWIWKVIIAFVIGLAIINASLIEGLILVNKDFEELEGLNGRTRLWDVYLQMIYEKPFLGNMTPYLI